MTLKCIEEMIKEHNIKTIYLDVDGVVLQSVASIVALLNTKYGTNILPIEILSWDFKEIKSDLTDDEIENLFSDARFFDIVEFYPNVIRFINKYRDKIIFVTKGTADNIKLKRKFFDEWSFGDIPIIGLPLNVSKGFVNMQYMGNSLFIDDCSQNLIDSNATVKILYREFDNNCTWQLGWYGLEMKGWD